MKNHTENLSITLCTKDYEEIEKIALALSSKRRLQIFEAIINGNRKVTTLAKALNIPTSNVVFHLNILEKSGLVYFTTLNQSLKINPLFSKISLLLWDDKNDLDYTKQIDYEYEVPIGAYIKIDNLINHIYSYSDKEKLPLTVNNIFDPGRINAQIIGARSALITYPMRPIDGKKKLKSIIISFEACSETSAYDNTFKSSISLLINNFEILTYICPGDFGGRKGLLTPKWYPANFTQFGEMVTIAITDEGVFKNGVLANNNITIKDIDLTTDNPTLSIGNKKDCHYLGGINIFGEKMGDYPQAIKIRYSYNK